MARSDTKELKIGPFSGGINAYSDPAMISDNEMVDCVNFDISLDGALVSRPPWGTLVANEYTDTDTSLTHPECYQEVIGTGTFESNRFIIVTSTHTGSEATYIYYVEGPVVGTIAKIADGVHTKAIRYANMLYIVPNINSSGTGCSYNLDTGVVTVLPNMPMGYGVCVYKDRLWISGRRDIADDSRLFFSGLGDFSSWTTGTDFFDIAPGDGDAVNDLIVYQDNIVIFKDNATYVFSYDTGPAQAVLQVINTDIGAMGGRCVDVYENSIFVLKYNQLYEMSNYDFIRVSVKIPFEYDDTLPTEFSGQTWKYPFWMRIVGDRAIVRFYNNLYIYHLRLRSWTKWDSQDENIKYLGPILRLDNTNTGVRRGFDTYVAGSTLSRVIDSNGPGATTDWNMYFKIFKLEDYYSSDNTENGDVTPPTTDTDILLSMTTKQFDVGLSHRFKRLMHWGLDCYTGRNVTGTLYPFSLAYKVTWGQLSIYNWHSLQTWDYPLLTVPGIEQEIASGSSTQVKFVRFPKSLRFRLLQFNIAMKTVGNTSDGPSYIYSITAFIGAKQIVPKGVN